MDSTEPQPAPETEPIIKYWYITYVGVPTRSQRKKIGTDRVHAATSIRHPAPEFMIGEATIGLQMATGFRAIVVTSWREISHEQHVEFMKNVFSHDPDAPAKEEPDVPSESETMERSETQKLQVVKSDGDQDSN